MYIYKSHAKKGRTHAKKAASADVEVLLLWGWLCLLTQVQHTSNVSLLKVSFDSYSLSSFLGSHVFIDGQ